MLSGWFAVRGPKVSENLDEFQEPGSPSGHGGGEDPFCPPSRGDLIKIGATARRGTSFRGPMPFITWRGRGSFHGRIPNENEGRKGKARCETATSTSETILPAFTSHQKSTLPCPSPSAKGHSLRSPVSLSSPLVIHAAVRVTFTQVCSSPWLVARTELTRGWREEKKKEEGKKGRKRRRKATKDVLTDASRSGIGFPLTSWWNICPDSWKMTRVISLQVAHTSFGFFYAIRTCILGTRAWQESDSTRFFVWRRSKHYNSLSLSLSRPQIYTVI